MNGTRHRDVDEYLERLRRSMKDLPAERRDEIVAEIRQHIDEELTLRVSATDADVRNVLERLGDPDDIAAEARERFGVPQAERATPWLEAVAIVLLLIPFLGWIVGMVLVWLSGIWTTREKVIATLLLPGGILATFLVTIGSSQAIGSGGGGVGPTEAVVLWVTVLLGIPPALFLGNRLRSATR
jgi:uncharacterized membrane protein